MLQAGDNNCSADELENAYVLSLRAILVRRLMEEEEYERWTMYARDERFELDVGRPKWELTRIVVCMLHCLMRVVKEKWDEVNRLRKRRVRWTIGGH